MRTWNFHNDLKIFHYFYILNCTNFQFVNQRRGCAQMRIMIFFICISANFKGKEEGRCRENARILSKSLIKTFLIYCKCITFGDVFFLAPLAVVSIRQIKYIAKCASI